MPSEGYSYDLIDVTGGDAPRITNLHVTGRCFNGEDETIENLTAIQVLFSFDPEENFMGSYCLYGKIN